MHRHPSSAHDNHLKPANTTPPTTKSKTRSISFFAIRHQLPNLTYLNIHDLDLTREHQWLHRAPFFRTVQRLRLYRLQTCHLSQLIRLINSFPSLSRLDVYLDFDKLENKGRIIPRPFRTDTKSLTWLQLDLKLGVSRLINWFLRTRQLLSRLRTLVLYGWNMSNEAEFRASFEGVGRLLDYCRDTVTDFRLHLNRVPILEDICDLSKYITYPSPISAYRCLQSN